VGASIIANNTAIDPDLYTNTVVAGAIADGSGWGVSSAIGGNAGTGDSWAIGHNGDKLYFGVGNGSADNTFDSYLVTGGTLRNLWLTPSSGGNVGIGIAVSTNPAYKLEVNGSFAATTKSFVIDHPSKPDHRLVHGSLEGPENGVYVRGKLNGSDTIVLPDYWKDLIDEDTITVNLTPIGKHQKLYVEEVSNTTITVGQGGLGLQPINCYYTVFAERKDVPKLVVEVKK
jgi:hypothetical protein